MKVTVFIEAHSHGNGNPSRVFWTETEKVKPNVTPFCNSHPVWTGEVSSREEADRVMQVAWDENTVKDEDGWVHWA